jgi:hypothetical protein
MPGTDLYGYGETDPRSAAAARLRAPVKRRQ